MSTNSIIALTSAHINGYSECLKTKLWGDIKESDGLIRDFGSQEVEINNSPSRVHIGFEAYGFSSLYLTAGTYFDDGDKYASLKLSMVERSPHIEHFNIMTNPGRNYHAFKPIDQMRTTNEVPELLDDSKPLPDDIESHILDNDGLNAPSRELPEPPPILTLSYTQALYRGLAQALRSEILTNQPMTKAA
jgi:hypothetical protein